MLFQIHSNWELKKAYESLLFWEKACLTINENPNDWDVIQEAKREIRAYNKKDDERNKDIITCFNNDDYGSLDYKIQLPEWIDTKEEAQEWFNENVRIRCMPHEYDCSGQIFTEFNTIFQNSEGRWMAYYINAMDI